MGLYPTIAETTADYELERADRAAEQKRRLRVKALADYDQLPQALRAYCQTSVIPWDAHLANHLLASGKSPQETIEELKKLEAAALNYATDKTWGVGYHTLAHNTPGATRKKRTKPSGR